MAAAATAPARSPTCWPTAAPPRSALLRRSSAAAGSAAAQPASTCRRPVVLPSGRVGHRQLLLKLGDAPLQLLQPGARAHQHLGLGIEFLARNQIESREALRQHGLDVAF